MRFYKDDRTCSYDPVNQKVNWAKLGIQMLDNYKEIQLYNVQFKIDTHKSIKLINKFHYYQHQQIQAFQYLQEYKYIQNVVEQFQCRLHTYPLLHLFV